MKKAIVAMWEEFPLGVKLALGWLGMLFLGIVAMACFGHPGPLLFVIAVVGLMLTILAVIWLAMYFDGV